MNNVFQAEDPDLSKDIVWISLAFMSVSRQEMINGIIIITGFVRVE